MPIALRKFIIRRYRLGLLFVFALLLSFSIYHSVRHSRLLRGNIIQSEERHDLFERELNELDNNLKRVGTLIYEADANLKRVRAEAEVLKVGNDNKMVADMALKRAELYAAVQELEMMLLDLEREREELTRERVRINEIREMSQKELSNQRQLLKFRWLWTWILNSLLVLNYYLYQSQIRAFIDRLHPVGCCRNCFYDLEGNQSGVCPECGTGVAAETHAATNLQS